MVGAIARTREADCLAPKLCPLGQAVHVMAGRWKPMIFCRLLEQPYRFNELQRDLSKVSHRVLAQQLRELEADGVLLRTVDSSVPPQVAYSLTYRGRALLPVLEALLSWHQERELEQGVSARTAA